MIKTAFIRRFRFTQMHATALRPYLRRVPIRENLCHPRITSLVFPGRGGILELPYRFFCWAPQSKFGVGAEGNSFVPDGTGLVRRAQPTVRNGGLCSVVPKGLQREGALGDGEMPELPEWGHRRVSETFVDAYATISKGFKNKMRFRI
jgi:hypothetical protein